MPTTWKNEQDRRVPCYQCTERHVGCHGTCEQYAAFRAEKDKAIQKRHQEQEMKDYRVEANIRCGEIRSTSFRREKRPKG